MNYTLRFQTEKKSVPNAPSIESVSPDREEIGREIWNPVESS